MSDLQRTADWHQQRLGKVTASRVADIIARTRSGWGAGRENYKAQLVCERLTGAPTECFTNAAMLWGIEKESEARQAYCFRFDCDVEEVGFIDHHTIAMAGASPDGLVGADGMTEFKCPQTATHIQTLLGGTIPEKYRTQMLWQMACTGRKWCDFASYDPRLPESMRLFVQRLERDDAEIAKLEALVIDFLSEVDETVAKLRSRYEAERLAA